MFKRLVAIVIGFMLTTSSFAGQVQTYKDYNAGDSFTDIDIDGNLNNIRNVLNGNLDNTNANTVGGFRFFEVRGSLPTAGTQGRVVYRTSDNTLWYDNGSTFLPFIATAGTPSLADILVYDGTLWSLLTEGAVGTFLMSSGSTQQLRYSKVELASTSSVNGILGSGNGGTGSNFASKTVGHIPYFSQTGVMATLAPGTSGQVLETRAAADPVFANPDYYLLSTTTVASAASTGNIAITAGRNYKVVVKGHTLVDNLSLNLIFNDDTGSTYTHIKSGFISGADSGWARATGAGNILLTPAEIDGDSGGPDFILNFDIITEKTDTTIVNAVGDVAYTRVTGPAREYTRFYGFYDGASAISSFKVSVNSGNNLDAVVYVYEQAIN